MRYRKVYGQSKSEECYFCGKTALCENKQGFSVCELHKNDIVEDKKCLCGEYMQVKRSKWGVFFLCPNCGPQSLKKAAEFSDNRFKLNKKYRKDDEVKEKEKIPTLEELEKMWDEEDGGKNGI